MNSKDRENHLQNILKFMARVQCTGNECLAWVQAVEFLNMEHNQAVVQMQVEAAAAKNGKDGDAGNGG